MRLVGVVGGSIGDDPFGASTWSGSCLRLFHQLEAQGLLERAFGARIQLLRRCALLARNFHTNRRIWRRHFYMDPAFREALTRAAQEHIRDEDYRHAFFQIGAQMNLARVLEGRSPCFSYHDSNIVISMQAAQAGTGVSHKRIDEALKWEQEAASGMTRIFTTSDSLRRSFVEDFSVPEERVVNVGAGFNLDIVPEEVSEKRYDTEELLFVGVEFERKGGPELLRAFEKVHSKRPKARLDIVGPRKLSIPPSLSHGVIYHGYLDKRTPEERARFEELLGKASLFVMPSLYEPFGIAPLEAMINQIPCIVTNGWALREMVSPGETGDLVRLGDVDDLAEKLLAHIGDADKLKSWGKRGRTRVLERFTWEHVAQRIKQAVGEATSQDA